MLQKLTSFTKTVAGLPDVPSPAMSALQLKQWFDTAPEEMRVAFNALIDALISTTAGDSGAKNIGVESIANVTGNNVQAVLQDLKQQINGSIAGSIPDGSITQAKLAFTIATNAASVSIADTGGHFTATNVEGALDELFQSANSVKTNVSGAIGSPATVNDTGAQLAGHITTQKGRLAAEIGDGNDTSTLQYLADRLIVRSDAIATQVNSKGVAATSADTLAQLATKIGQIVTGLREASGSSTSDGTKLVTVTGLAFQPVIVIVKWAADSGYNSDFALYVPKSRFSVQPTGDGINVYVTASAIYPSVTVSATGFTAKTQWATQSFSWIALG